MVTKISTKLNGTCSKADEIEFLDAVVAAAGEGSYLATLFTSEAVTWMKSQIKNDFDCDLFGRWNKEEEAANDWMLRHDSEKGGRILEKERLENLLIKAHADLALKMDELKKAEIEFEKQINNANDLLAESYRDETRLRADLEFNKNLVIRLKALLFDLQNPAIA